MTADHQYRASTQLTDEELNALREIWAESEGPGEGARFLFTLPVATPHES